MGHNKPKMVSVPNIYLILFTMYYVFFEEIKKIYNNNKKILLSYIYMYTFLDLVYGGLQSREMRVLCGPGLLM